MNKIKLFFLLRKNVKLSNKRNVMFEANQYGKFFGYIIMAILSIEFIALGTFFGWLAAKEQTPEMVLFFMPFLLILDFGGRFATQQTPMMLVKPYLLTPISKYSAIECFLIQQLLDGGNFVWMTLFLPYTFIVWCGGMTGWAAIGMLCLMHLMVLVNSQWYLLIRTLVNQSIFWWALPIVLIGSVVLPFFILSDNQIDALFDFLGDHIGSHVFSWWTFAVIAIIFAILFAINRHMQMGLIYDEISKKEKTKLKHVSEFKALNRFGQIGEYLKLEIKSTMRNKAIRSRFIQGICFITFFSLAISFLDIYRSSFERNFFCLYCFLFFGSVNLTKVMCPEGNYIDLLMVHEENILTLLRAKYYYYCGMFFFVPNAIQLRGQSFLWMDDLSTYDPIWEWGTNIWGIGDHLSLTCILFCAAQLIYTWISMRQQRDQMVGAQADQMKVMQYMMYIMPLMFFFIFNDYSSGLNFYYFISLFMSAAIMWTLRKTTNDEKLLAILEANYQANKNNPKKQNSFAARLEAMQKQADAMREQQRNRR